MASNTLTVNWLLCNQFNAAQIYFSETSVLGTGNYSNDWKLISEFLFWPEGMELFGGFIAPNYCLQKPANTSFLVSAYRNQKTAKKSPWNVLLWMRAELFYHFSCSYGNRSILLEYLKRVNTSDPVSCAPVISYGQEPWVIFHICWITTKKRISKIICKRPPWNHGSSFRVPWQHHDAAGSFSPQRHPKGWFIYQPSRQSHGTHLPGPPLSYWT